MTRNKWYFLLKRLCKKPQSNCKKSITHKQIPFRSNSAGRPIFLHSNSVSILLLTLSCYKMNLILSLPGIKTSISPFCRQDKLVGMVLNLTPCLQADVLPLLFPATLVIADPPVSSYPLYILYTKFPVSSTSSPICCLGNSYPSLKRASSSLPLWEPPPPLWAELGAVPPLRLHRTPLSLYFISIVTAFLLYCVCFLVYTQCSLNFCGEGMCLFHFYIPLPGTQLVFSMCLSNEWGTVFWNRKKAVGWEPSVGFRAHTLALSDIFLQPWV